jgi:hypothetical protein
MTLIGIFLILAGLVLFILNKYNTSAKTKITKTANIVIIETIGNKPHTMMDKLKKLKENGFQTIVIFLEIAKL